MFLRKGLLLLRLNLALFTLHSNELLVFKVVSRNYALQLLNYDSVLLPNQVKSQLPLDVEEVLPELPG